MAVLGGFLGGVVLGTAAFIVGVCTRWMVGFVHRTVGIEAPS